MTYQNLTSINYVKKSKEEEDKKIQLKKKVKNKKNSSCFSFVFAFETFISPNLQLVLEKNLHTRVDLKEQN